MATIQRTPMIDDDGTGTTGTVINAAWKSELYDQIDAAIAAGGGVKLYASVSSVSGQSIPSGAHTPLVFLTEDVDVGGLFAPAQNTRLTIPAGGAGFYLLSGIATMAPSSSTAPYIAGVRLNGGTYLAFIGGVFHPAAGTGCALGLQLLLNAGDFLELTMYQTTGGALNSGGGGSTNRFALNRLA